MEDIKITMGAVETFNERIEMAEGELNSLNQQAQTINMQLNTETVKRVSVKTARIVGMVFLSIVSLCMFIASIYGGGLIVFCLSAICIFVVYKIYKKNYAENSNIPVLNDKLKKIRSDIAEKTKEINMYKEKKRELVLVNERKINDSMSDTIDESFAYDSMNETKECPQCAETVKAKAKICRYCGYKFENP